MSSPGYKKGIWPGQIEGRTHRDTTGPQRGHYLEERICIPGYILWSSTYLLFGNLWYQVGHLCSLHAKGAYGYKSCRRRRHPTKGDLCVFAQNDSRNGMSLSAHVIPTSQDPTRGTRAGKNIHHMLAIKNRTHLFKGISDRKQNSILETYA